MSRAGPLPKAAAATVPKGLVLAGVQPQHADLAQDREQFVNGS
jgi:hypothetical protein